MNHHQLITTAIIMLMLIVSSGITAQTYNVSYKNETVESVTKDLRKKTGYLFVCKKEVLEGTPRITCDIRNATFTQLLNRIFYDMAGLEYDITKGTVILKKAAVNRPYFKKLITGMVTDSKGETLPGVTVIQTGTTNGVSTDVDGSFSLLVEGNAPQLEFSYVGMKGKKVQLSKNGEKFILIKLENDETLLDEVFVTGYQNIKRENATGSYQLIDSKELDNHYTNDVSSRLEGQIPGLTIYSNGKNGTGENAMTIRGISSLQARTSPLVVVDGLPIEGSIETVNPYDIENITVLKDASAASIYGARASNGVIVITTKRAHSERLSIDVNTDFTIYEKETYGNRKWASPSQLLELEKYNFDAVQANDEAYNALLGTYQENPYSVSPALRLMLTHKLGTLSDADYQSQMLSLSKNNYRDEWRDAMLRTRVLRQYNVALRSMGKKINSNIVLNYKGDNTGTIHEHDNTFNMSYQGVMDVTKWLDLSFGIDVISERSKTQESLYNLKSIYSFQPYLSMYNSDGSLAQMEAETYLGEASLSNTALGLKSETFNLMDERNMNFSNARRNNIRSYVHADFKILPELSINTRFQYEDITYKNETYYEADSYDMRHLYNLYTSGGKHYLPEGGMLKSQHQTGDYYTFRVQGNYAKTFAKIHAVDAIAGFEYRQTHNRYTNDLLLGYDDRTQTNMNSIVNFNDLLYLTGSDLGQNYIPSGVPTSTDFSTSDILHRFYSYYFNGNYTYDSRYTASFSYRVDKADLFGADPKYRGRPLWSVGASWNIQNEKFMKQYTWIDALKLRASYGLTGNIDQNVSSYLTATMGINSLNGKKSATLNTPPNDQLRWEKTASWNVGLDFSLFGNRLSGSFDAYRKTSSDLLSLTDIDPTTGWTSLTINNGKARNEGLELQLNGAIIKPETADKLGINASFNISYNKNKVLRIDYEPASGYDALTTCHEGHPVNSLYSYRYAGIVTDESGTQSYSWYKHDGTVSTTPISSQEFTVDDIVFSGGLDPKVVATFQPEITWKGFSLSALFAFYGGHYMRAGMENYTHEGYYYGYPTQLNDVDAIPASYLDYWTSANKATTIANGYPSASTIGDFNYIDATVVHADYLKVRDIVLGYTFSKLICNRLGIQGLRLRLQMTNVATWVRNSLGIDPEACNPLTGYATNKTPKSYTMSLSINL
jgi:TonB-linked SusC/RagA family outer membrane protein